MDQLKHEAFCQSIQPPNPKAGDFRQTPDLRGHSNRLQSDMSQPEVDPKDTIAARKVQKADREKLRRDRLNEQFIELGNALDPDRPKNDKATILADTVQMLKDMTAQVNKLKAEYASLTEESRELTQEKNDLREEKASLKADIENLNLQYQQRVRALYPWAAMDHSVVMGPPSYPYPVPLPIPSGPIPPGPIPMHPSMQPYPFFGNQNSTFVPYLTPNTFIEQQSAHYVSPVGQSGSRSNLSSKQDPKKKPSSDHQGESKTEKSEDSDDVATELELKTPGSMTDQDFSSGHRKFKKSVRRESNSLTEGSSSSRCSSSRSVHDSSSNSVVGGTKADD